MSASREKQNRQASGADRNAPKTARQAQQRKEEARSNLLYGLIAAAVVIAVIASIAWRSNFIPKMTTAVTIDGEKYTASEVAYYYQTAYRNFVNQYSYFTSYLGLNTSASLKNQEINSSAAAMLGIEVPEAAGSETEGDAESVSAGVTWRDYFLNQALENMTVVQGALKAADAEGFQYPASVQVQYDDSMEALKSNAAASGVSMGQYLKGTFGAGITEKVYGEQLMRVLRYSAYSQAYQNSLSYSESELQAAYQADPNSYDHVSYEVVSFSGDATTTLDNDGNSVEPTEEESAAALAAAKESAQAVLDGFKGGTSLEDLAEEQDGTYNNYEDSSYSAGDALSEWLFDSSRKVGDADIVESGTVQYVVVFHDRFREEYSTVNIRHILVPLGSATLTESDDGYDEEQAQLKAEAHAKAEELLAQWQSGEATEDSFASLAMAESADSSKYDGGLYTRVAQGQMVTEFNDWCFDASRKPGDTGVVDTRFGSHVMYFSGTDLDRWQAQIAAVLKSEDYSEWEEGLTANISIERSESGLKFIG